MVEEIVSNGVARQAGRFAAREPDTSASSQRPGPSGGHCSSRRCTHNDDGTHEHTGARASGAGHRSRSSSRDLEGRQSCGSIVHNGDNKTGVGDSDDETLTIDLTRVPAEVDKVTFAVTIHEADARRQNFGMVAKAYIRCLDANDSKEIARYDLSEDSSTETAMVFGEIYRNGADWKFKAVGQGFKGGLAPLARSFGVDA